MRYNTHGKEKKNVESNIVGNIMDANANMHVGATNGIANNKILQDFFKDRKKTKAIVVLLVIFFVLLAIFIMIRIMRKQDNSTKPTIYDIAYANLKFIENPKLKKLSCHKNNVKAENEVKSEDVVIYYFDNDDIDTVIYHTDITLSENYMDYFETMYTEYDKMLDNEYHFDNVKSSLTTDHNRLLVTIIVSNKKDVENKLGALTFTNYDDAKKTNLAAGYNCN